MASLVVDHEDLPPLPSDSENDEDYAPEDDEDDEGVSEASDDEEKVEDDDKEKVEDADEDADEADATLTQLAVMAHNLHAQGELEKAEKMYRGVLAGREASAGPAHPKTLFAMNNLALFLQQAARFSPKSSLASAQLIEAERLMRCALSGYETAKGADDSETLCCCNNLAQLLYVQEKIEDVEPLFRRAFLGNEQKLGPNHPSTLASVSNLARVLDDLDQFEEASILYERLLATKQGADAVTEDTLEEVNELSKFYRRQNKFDKALPLSQRAVDGRSQVLGDHHPDTLASMYGLAAILIAKKEWSGAESAARQSLEGYVKLKMKEDVEDGIVQISEILQATGRGIEMPKLQAKYNVL